MESQTLKSLLTLFFFISITSTASVVASSSSVVPSAKPHIKKACRTTPYPHLCETSLTLYASHTKITQQELCRAAMVSSLKAAENVTSIISKLSSTKGSPYEAEVLRDCIDHLKDSVYELHKATVTIKSLSRASDVDFQLNSIKTWVSAAQTNVITCTDEMSGSMGRKVRSKVKKEMEKCAVIVVRQISNALSLINNFKYKS